ncbi:MAG TPA: histidine triad nucleotide-binding protein [Clostridia bacterium]|mgnify:FL=1|jgi:histidine triad (HIT) family protein|nr:histidine triad nucleotide-binding protein [Clostridia bacterium]
MNDCIFCKIATKQVPAELVYEDDLVVVFRDLAPQAPVHLLIVPKKHIPTLQHLSTEDNEIITNIFSIIPKLAEEFQVERSGYRLVANCGKEGGQSVFHIHFHFLAGRQMNWPPG